MTEGIFTIYDAMAEVFLTPWFARNDATARRSFSVAVNDTQHDFGKFPTDFVLYRIGSFNAEDGSVTPEAPTKLAIGIELVESE